MKAVILERASDLEHLCLRYNVERLAPFGSAASGSRAKGASDLDFLVKFQPLPAGAIALNPLPRFTGKISAPVRQLLPA